MVGEIWINEFIQDKNQLLHVSGDTEPENPVTEYFGTVKKVRQCILILIHDYKGCTWCAVRIAKHSVVRYHPDTAFLVL